MAPAAQSVPYQNPGIPSDDLNESLIVSGSHAVADADFPDMFTEEALEETFSAQKLQEIFDSIVDEFAAGSFLPALVLTKCGSSPYLNYIQQSKQNWLDPEVISEQFRAKIRRTVSGFVSQLFDVHPTYPALDTSVGAQPIGGIADIGVNWQMDNEIIPALELLSKDLTKESFLEAFAFKVWLDSLLSEGTAMNCLLSFQTHRAWKVEEGQDRKRIVLKFAGRKIYHILNQSYHGESDSSLDLSPDESVPSDASGPLLDDNIEGKIAEEVVDRRLVHPVADRRKNASYHYLVRWRETTARSWVAYETLLTNPDLVPEFKRKYKLANSRRSPKRLNRTNRI